VLNNMQQVTTDLHFKRYPLEGILEKVAENPYFVAWEN
jgi:hypothetical protein